MLPEYTFTTVIGWTLLRDGDGWLSAAGLPLTDDDPAETLFQHGYKPLATSGYGRNGVGSFAVWHATSRPEGWLQYCVEILQDAAASVVWIGALPDLWDFLRLYGPISIVMDHTLPGEDEDGEEEAAAEEGQDGEGVEICGAGGWVCPDCLTEQAAAAERDPIWDGRDKRRTHDDA